MDLSREFRGNKTPAIHFLKKAILPGSVQSNLTFLKLQSDALWLRTRTLKLASVDDDGVVEIGQVYPNQVRARKRPRSEQRGALNKPLYPSARNLNE
jgi:hypothetical protein